MAISYSMIVGNKGKATLPSVESWGADMNILRDPPKSITTRRIDKVGETSEITQMIQDANDRANEAILVYARGTNPMVSVSYDNAGNNGGGRNQNAVGSGRQAYLPYRIMNGGAFRPPIRDQRELLPLSRLPRAWTSSFTQPGFADFSKKAMCPGTDEDTKGVKKPDQMLKACARPTVTYRIETPIVETYEVKQVIKNPIAVSVGSGKENLGKFNGEMGVPTSQIIDDTLKYDYEANKSSNLQVLSIDEIYGINTEKGIKDQHNISYTAPEKHYNKTEYIHDEINLERVIPEHQAYTNLGKNIYKRTEHVAERSYVPNRPVASAVTNFGRVGAVDTISNRTYNLKPTVNPGGFAGAPNLPGKMMENQIMQFDAHKSQMRRQVYEMQQARGNPYDNLNEGD